MAGNKETLDVIPKSKGIVVRDKLLDFHNTLYSANIMCLAVLGKGEKTTKSALEVTAPIF